MFIAAGLGLGLMISGCGGGGGNGGGSDPDSYLPLEVGNSWEYRMTLAPGLIPAQVEQNQEFDYHETVIGIGVDQGLQHFVIQAVREETETYPELETFQLRRVDANAIYARLPLFDDAHNFTGYYDSPHLKLPPRLGDTWEDPEVEASFTTAAVDEQITVPAGTFSSVRVEQSSSIPGPDGTSLPFTIKTWYALGVGIVKDETWEGDVKTSMIELREYDLR